VHEEAARRGLRHESSGEGAARFVRRRPVLGAASLGRRPLRAHVRCPRAAPVTRGAGGSRQGVQDRHPVRGAGGSSARSEKGSSARSDDGSNARSDDGSNAHGGRGGGSPRGGGAWGETRRGSGARV